MFFSRPPEVEEYCHAFMVVGVLKDFAIVEDRDTVEVFFFFF